MTQEIRLPANVPIVDEEGKPTLAYQRKWQEIIERLEALEAAP